MRRNLLAVAPLTLVVGLGLFAGVATLSGCSGGQGSPSQTLTAPEDIEAHKAKMNKILYEPNPSVTKKKRRR